MYLLASGCYELAVTKSKEWHEIVKIMIAVTRRECACVCVCVCVCVCLAAPHNLAPRLLQAHSAIRSVKNDIDQVTLLHLNIVKEQKKWFHAIRSQVTLAVSTAVVGQETAGTVESCTVESCTVESCTVESCTVESCTVESC